MNLDLHQLLTALDLFKPLVDPKATIPIIQNVRLTVGCGSCTLSATDLDTHLHLTLPVDGVGTFPSAVLLNYRRLTQLLGALGTKKGQIILEAERAAPNGGVAMLKAIRATVGKRTFSVTLADALPEEWPAPHEIENPERRQSYTAADLAALPWLASASGIDASRFVLNCVAFDGDKLITTDGYRLHLTTGVPQLTEGKDSAAMLTSPAVAVLCRWKYPLDIALALTPPVFAFSGQYEGLSLAMTSRGIDGDFPGYGKLVPETTDWKIRVDVKALAEAVKLGTKITDGEALTLRLADRQLRVESKGEGDVQPTIEEIDVEVTTAGKKAPSIAVNPRYLTEALAGFEGTCELWLGDGENDSGTPLLLSGGNNTALVVPVTSCP